MKICCFFSQNCNIQAQRQRCGTFDTALLKLVDSICSRPKASKKLKGLFCVIPETYSLYWLSFSGCDNSEAHFLGCLSKAHSGSGTQCCPLSRNTEKATIRQKIFLPNNENNPFNLFRRFSGGKDVVNDNSNNGVPLSPLTFSVEPLCNAH